MESPVGPGSIAGDEEHSIGLRMLINWPSGLTYCLEIRDNRTRHGPIPGDGQLRRRRRRRAASSARPTRCGLSKAAVSRHVAELETAPRRAPAAPDHAAALADRRRRAVLRTRAARRLLAAVDEAEAEISSRSGEASGRAAHERAGQLRRAAPGAAVAGASCSCTRRSSLDIDLADRIVDLVEEGYDLAVRIASLPSSSAGQPQLATTRMVAVRVAAYLAQHGTPAHPTELAGARGHLLQLLRRPGDEWAFTAPDGSSVAVRTHARIHANSGDTCRAAALRAPGHHPAAGFHGRRRPAPRRRWSSCCRPAAR